MPTPPNPFRHLDGQVVLITGAGRGLGRAYALAFAAEGAAVVVNDRDQDTADAVVAEIAGLGGRAVSAVGSVADPETVREIVATAVKHFGRLDVMVTNAGADRRGFVLDLTPDDWQATLATHVFGTIHCSVEAAKVMREQGGGVIINVTSAAFFAGSPKLAPYCTSKGAIYGFMRASAQELAAFGITVNAVSPPMTETEPVMAYLETLREIGLTDEQVAGLASTMSAPADVAPIAVFLATPEGRKFSGQVFTMTAGTLSALVHPATGTDAIAPPSGWSIESLSSVVPGLLL